MQVDRPKMRIVPNEQRAQSARPRTYAFKVLEDGLVEVYDLDFAGYCLMRDVVVADMIEIGPGKRNRTRQFIFYFQVAADEIARLSIDYTNSESARHAVCVRRIKKAIRSVRPREG